MAELSNKPFGEVIASTLNQCTVQSWNWDRYPLHGTFITLCDTMYSYAAIIHTIETVPLNSARIPVAYKKTHAELIAEHPHIFSLLRTTLQCTLLGIYTSKSIHPVTKPPLIHSFSTTASMQEVQDIIKTTHYIRTLINLLDPSLADPLIYSLITHQQQNVATPEHQQAIIKEYIHCIGNDYKRIHNLNAHIQNNL